MHSLRRAAARAACSSSKAVAVPRQQVASFAMQISKANVRPATMLPLARHFSQTSRVAQDEEKAAIEEAIKSTEETGSTTDASQEPRPIRQADISPEQTIFISNISFDVTDVHIREAFGKYGEILRVSLARDARGLSRGFGFVDFKDPESSSRAISEANKSFWHGRCINVAQRLPTDITKSRQRAGKNFVVEPTNSLFIGNIPYETSDADLNRMFKDLENIQEVRVAVDRNTGWPRGFAHADFPDVEAAKKAYEQLQNFEINGRKIRVDFAAQREPARTNRLQQS
ncbi:RNA-binding domain-containing protein [Hypomontagnella monticulosa]|nr:RNA-binding domain-containing protein [Hypomontagnella monticulosa]